MMRRLVKGIMWYSLRRTFRRICWIGDWPSLPADRPVVLYANHHYYHDGYLLLRLLRELNRDALVWMRELHRFPLFRTVGALPFPQDDAAARAATLRKTVRRMRRNPQVGLVYFPEGHQHPPEDDLLAFPPEAVLARLDRLLPDAAWWPVALHLTWWGEPRPTALLTGGPLHDAPDGNERTRLAALRDRLHAPDPRPRRVLRESANSFF